MSVECQFISFEGLPKNFKASVMILIICRLLISVINLVQLTIQIFQISAPGVSSLTQLLGSCCAPPLTLLVHCLIEQLSL